VLERGLGFEQIPDLDRIQVDDRGSGAGRERHQQRVEMGLVAVGGDHHHLGDAVVLPARQQLVDGAVQRLAPQGGRPREAPAWVSRHAVGEGGHAQDPDVVGRAAGDRLREERVGSERQMRTVLLERADREEEARVACEQPPGLLPGEVVEGV
jgi:hypothetical protein